MANTSNESLDDSVAASKITITTNHLRHWLISWPNLVPYRSQQRQLRSISQKIKAYENEPVKKLKLLNLDDCAKKFAFQKDEYDSN